MPIRIDGTNTAANPGITGTDADTGLQFGTDEVKIVTGGTEKVKVDSAGVLSFDSGFGSVREAYGCRAWVQLDQTSTQAILGSAGVSSITDNGLGATLVNFSSDMPDTNYVVTTGANQSNNSSGNYLFSVCVQGTAVDKINVLYRPAATSDTKQDVGKLQLAIFR
jgi:hypothetical protein